MENTSEDMGFQTMLLRLQKNIQKIRKKQQQILQKRLSKEHVLINVGKLGEQIKLEKNE